jgi:prepilin-type N-terminal cleavage/methylation domain-containing protein
VGHTATGRAKIGEEKGFTLLEVIVAISLLTFGLLGVASMQVAAIKGNAFAGGVTEATTLAGDRLEYLMTLNYDDPADSTELLDDVDGDGAPGLNDATSATADHYRTYTDENGTLYNLYWNTARDVPTADTTIVKVIVTWSNRGILKKVSVQCIVSKTS